jgi:hypothetical protein
MGMNGYWIMGSSKQQQQQQHKELVTTTVHAILDFVHATTRTFDNLSIFTLCYHHYMTSISQEYAP